MSAPWGENLHYICTCTVPPYSIAPPRHSTQYCPVTWDGEDFSLIYVWSHADLPLPAHQIINTDQDLVSDGVLHLLMRCPAVCIQAHVPQGVESAPKHYQIFLRANMVHEQLSTLGYFEGQAALIRTLSSLKSSITIEPHRVQHWAKPPVGTLMINSPVRNETLVPWQRQLRPLQIAAVEWMQSLELSHGIQLRFDPRIPITPDVAVDMSRTITMSTSGILPEVKTTKCRIGVLTGERGVGKTSALLGLAVSLACNPPTMDPLTDAFESACFTPCKATLIIIPRHLLTTWKMELESCCPNARVLYLCNHVGHGSNSPTDLDSLMNAHIVVTTSKYLRRNTMHNFLLPLLPENSANDDISFHAHFYIKHLMGIRPHPAFMQNLPLDLFKWRRIVVDEAFEYPTKVTLKADFYWFLGADADKVHSSQLVSSIQCASGIEKNDWTASAIATFSTYCTYTIRRQDVPTGAAALIDITRFVQMYPIENMRYEAALSANWPHYRLIKLCCGFSADQPGQFLPPVPLSEIIAKAQDTHESTMRALPAELMQTEILSHRRFQEMVARMGEEPPEECPVCYMNNTTIITTCGHTFCWTCMFRVFLDSTDAPCPCCRRLLGKQRDVYQHLTSADSAHGAKVNALQSLLQEIMPQESCVIFVAWHSIALALSNIIPGSRLMTNKNSESTLSSFSKSTDEEPARILILTFQQCHGLSLTRANHVIFYHPPLYQSDEDSAISCVQRDGQTRTVHVHRLIVNGAVECGRFS